MTWPANCATWSNDIASTVAKTVRKLYIPVVTLLDEDKAKLFQKLSPDFERTINWNNCQSKVTTQVKSQYLYYLIDPSFQGVNISFFLSYE